MLTGSCLPSGVFIDEEMSSSRVLEESLHRQKALRRHSRTFESNWNPPAAAHGSPQGRVTKQTAQMREVLLRASTQQQVIWYSQETLIC